MIGLPLLENPFPDNRFFAPFIYTIELGWTPEPCGVIQIIKKRPAIPINPSDGNNKFIFLFIIIP